MKSPISSGLLFAALLIATTSCSVVASKQIVGSDPIEDCAAIAGHWMAASGETITISVDEEVPGRLLLSSKDDEFVDTQCHLRQSGDWMFLNVSWKPEDEEERRWIWRVATLSEDDLLLWNPDVEQFAQLVRENRIPGSVVETKSEKMSMEQADGSMKTVNSLPKTDVTIDDPDGKWVKQLVDGELGMPIRWREPDIWRRIDAEGNELPRSRHQEEEEDEPESEKSARAAPSPVLDSKRAPQ